MVSTRSLHRLPDIEPLRRTCQAIATLDAVLRPEREFRYYTYQQKWAPDQQLASMRDGSGDEWHLLFSAAGAVMKGFVHDAAMATPVNKGRSPWPGVIDTLPPVFAAQLGDKSFALEAATFCVWRERHEPEWRRGHVQFPSGPDPDGSEHLMSILAGDPVTYARWAEQYYEIEIPFIEVRRIYLHRPMTEEMVKSLNPQADWGSLVEDLDNIGYPISERMA
jgi:hypothetical protein